MKRGWSCIAQHLEASLAGVPWPSPLQRGAGRQMPICAQHVANVAQDAQHAYESAGRPQWLRKVTLSSVVTKQGEPMYLACHLCARIGSTSTSSSFLSCYSSSPEFGMPASRLCVQRQHRGENTATTMRMNLAQGAVQLFQMCGKLLMPTIGDNASPILCSY
jgi:hypothetical protein